jgi:hypothetical protein
LTKSDKEAPGGGKPLSGEVRHDERGHAVWVWATDTARNAVNSASQMLRKLDLSNLSLEDEDRAASADVSAKAAAAAEALSLERSGGNSRGPRKPASGFNPYDGVAKPSAAHSPRSAGAARAAVRKSPRATAPPRSSWWRRLFRLG